MGTHIWIDLSPEGGILLAAGFAGWHSNTINLQRPL